jgi:hypothetical protein
MFYLWKIGSIKKDLEMRSSGRSEGLIVIVVDESCKLPLFDGGGQFMDDNEQVGGNEDAIKEAREEPTNNDVVVVEGLGEER